MLLYLIGIEGSNRSIYLQMLLKTIDSASLPGYPFWLSVLSSNLCSLLRFPNTQSQSERTEWYQKYCHGCVYCDNCRFSQQCNHFLEISFWLCHSLFSYHVSQCLDNCYISPRNHVHNKGINLLDLLYILVPVFVCVCVCVCDYADGEIVQGSRWYNSLHCTRECYANHNVNCSSIGYIS